MVDTAKVGAAVGSAALMAALLYAGRRSLTRKKGKLEPLSPEPKADTNGRKSAQDRNGLNHHASDQSCRGRAYPLGLKNVDTDIIIPGGMAEDHQPDGTWQRRVPKLARGAEGNVFDDPEYQGAPRS